MSDPAKNGYKQTEAGLIPDGWSSKVIDDLAKFSGGSQPPSSTFKFSPEHGYIRLIQIRDYKTDSYTTYIPLSMARKFCTKNDIMIGRYGPPIFQILRGIDGAYNVALIKATPTEDVESEYLFNILRQDILFKFIESLSRRSSGQTGIEIPALKAYPIALPPLPEQRAIASALADVDALLDSLEELLTKKRQLKQAAMQELLTGKTRLEGFEGEWEEKRLGEVCDIDSESLGIDTPPDFEFRYIALEDVSRGKLKSFSEIKFLNSPSRARRVIKHSDILVSTVRPNLRSHLLFKNSGSKWICSTGFSVLRCYRMVIPEYITHHFFAEFINSQIENIITGSNYPAINSRDVSNLLIPLPPLPEQKAIASILSEMDAELEALEGRITKTRDLKQGMMQELLTGRTRLV